MAVLVRRNRGAIYSVQKGDAYAAPAAGSNYQIVFSPARGEPTVVAGPANCMSVNVSIGGHQVSDLYPATALLSAAARAVHHG